MESRKARVISHNSDRFEICEDGKISFVRARGKLKRDGELLVGDFVETKEADGETVISSVYPRRNSLIRPAVANVDAIVIVISPSPEPDFMLADKMVINCKRAGIDCIICLNKRDTGGISADEVRKQYGSDVSEVVTTSALLGEIDELVAAIRGKLVCFAGQSGVGKSTLVNAIVGEDRHRTGEISEKIMRGKNTTTSARIVETDDGLTIIDTPGFSMLDAFEEDYRALASYYDDYVELADDCRFHPCTHTAEPDCAVKRAVEEGRLDKNRYDRYAAIFAETKDAYKSFGRK